MKWTAYRVVFRLMSPLHIGYLKIGNVQRTRPYVMAKALWGALTARLTRDCPELGSDYQVVGQCVREQLAFSYFYPALECDRPLYPDYTLEGLRYGPEQMEPEEFAWCLIASYASTALDAQRASAEEGSLHEVEFVSPWVRAKEKDCSKPVYLVGYIFERQGCELRWREVLDRLQLGGERKYGWGRVCKQEEPKVEGTFFGYELDLNGFRPRVKIKKCQPLLAHGVLDGLAAKGQIEPLVGRETENGGKFGAHLSRARICWVPGSRLIEERVLSIGDYGFWQTT